MSPTAAPTSSASPNPLAYVCPSSDSVASVAQGPISATSLLRHGVAHGQNAAASTSNLLEVTYNRAFAIESTATIARREQSLNASLVRTFDFPRLGTLTRVLAVDPADIASTEDSLRAQSGVVSVTLAGARWPTTVSGPYFSNDPYFNGFAFPEDGAAPTYQVAPYEESADVPGQWDMHAVQLEHAFEYSQANNGSTVPANPDALGSSSIKIAIIDTGEDPTHPELQSKIVYQRCFITNTTQQTPTQSTSDFAPDPQGHGTDVAGIAAADLGNSLGFVGDGGNVVIYGYRVFPEPDDSCTAGASSPDAQCSADSTDVASAIDDAIAQKVNVISMSLGGGNCTNGQDPSAAEGGAVAAALAANIIVVAASGNDKSSAVDAPGCDTGVIAVGASALDDGQPNGTNNGLGSASSPIEYVPSYSNYGGTAAAHQASAWGIVAPGGDPSCPGSGPCGEADDLHWIENIWTSEPYQANAGDKTFAGECDNDYPNPGGLSTTPDCRAELAGTSMATPHVAGAAALILSVNATYQSPAKMKTLLCSTADDIKVAHEGCGRLNVYRAMATALNDPSLP